MSGIYIHIPFCASRCIYCDFYSTTLRGKGHDYVDAIIKEYNQRSDFLPNREPLRTIYIGGGTPSQLPPSDLVRLISSLKNSNPGIDCFEHIEEITIEANPEDVTEEWTSKIAEIGLIKKGLTDSTLIESLRISMGVQSMIDSELKTLNRRHGSNKPSEAVRILRKHGIKNISLDLMYGLPNQTLESWERSIDGIIDLKPEHISAYCLSIEEDTTLEKLISQGKLTACDDETCLQMAELLRSKLKSAGYFQYEISNYSKLGFESKHNSSYWNGTPYLGLGPGAHSYNGCNLRCWNEPDVIAYMNDCRKEECEVLNASDLFNEKIMLGLRTAIGVDYEDIDTLTTEEERLEIKNRIEQLTSRELVTTKNNHLVLTEAGLALADEVIRELLII